MIDHAVDRAIAIVRVYDNVHVHDHANDHVYLKAV